MKVQKAVKTAVTCPRTSGDGPLYEAIERIFSSTVDTLGIAVRDTLEMLHRYLEISRFEDGYLQFADLVVPIPPGKEDNARKLIEQNPEEERRKRGKPPRKPLTSAKERARPKYRNGYNMIDTELRDGVLHVRCRIAESFSWISEGGKQKGKCQRDVNLIDVTHGLQGLIKTWIRPPLDGVPSPLAAGVCQKAGTDLASHLGLLTYGKMPKVSFPGLESRDQEERLQEWHQSIRDLVRNPKPMDHAMARELNPHKYAEGDRKGDRLICVDPHWLTFVGSPFPNRQTGIFVQSKNVVVYEWSRNGRLYAVLPLGELAGSEELFWWQAYAREFSPLAAWPDEKLSVKRDVLLVPLQIRAHTKGKRKQRIMDLLSPKHDRSVCWSILSEKNESGGRRWEVHFATARTIAPKLRENVLGIHLGSDGALWWHVADRFGNTLDSGKTEDAGIMNQALSHSLLLRTEQGKQRWVGDKKSKAELKRRTYELAHAVIALAADWNANIAIEKISWADKRSGGSESNRRHSLWNYSQLPSLIEDIGISRVVDELPGPISVIVYQSDYLLRHTCPKCGACRKEKQTKEKADTYLARGILECRKCGHSGSTSHEVQAQWTCEYGVQKMNEIIEKENTETED